MFFAIVFPLMFLVLFGGIFGDQGQSAGRPDRRSADVLAARPAAAGRQGGVRRRPSRSATPTTSTRRIAEVRKGDADVAVEMQGDTLVAHYTQTDQVKAAVTQGTLQAFVDGANVGAPTGQPPTLHAARPSRSRTTR